MFSLLFYRSKLEIILAVLEDNFLIHGMKRKIAGKNGRSSNMQNKLNCCISKGQALGTSLLYCDVSLNCR
jgi:hypothetical protein